MFAKLTIPDQSLCVSKAWLYRSQAQVEVFLYCTTTLFRVLNEKHSQCNNTLQLHTPNSVLLYIEMEASRNTCVFCHKQCEWNESFLLCDTYAAIFCHGNSCFFLPTRPRYIDMTKVFRQNNIENLEQAFNIAEKDLGVTRLLDPEGTCSAPRSPPSPLLSSPAGLDWFGAWWG